jgi:hypothetical protein
MLDGFNRVRRKAQFDPLKTEPPWRLAAQLIFVYRSERSQSRIAELLIRRGERIHAPTRHILCNCRGVRERVNGPTQVSGTVLAEDVGGGTAWQPSHS